LFFVDWLGRTVLFLAVFAICLFVIDYTIILPLQLRILAEIGALMFVGYVTYHRLVRPLSLSISDDDLALLVEREYPHLKNRLISAIQLGRSRDVNPAFNSPELIDKLVGETTQEAQGLEFSRILTPRFAVRPLIAGVLMSLLIAGGAFADPTLAGIFVKRLFSEAKWPAETDIEVLGFDPVTKKLVVPKGEDVQIRVKAHRKIPKRLALYYEFRNPREEGNDKMTPLPDGQFMWLAPRVTSAFKFYVSTRDVETEWYTVEVLDPPELKEPQLFFSHPKYLQMPDTRADAPETNPNVKVPMHTKVKFVAACEQDLQEAELLLGFKSKEKVTSIPIANDAKGQPRVVTAEFTVDTESSEYSIRIKGKSGLWSRDPLRYSIKGLIDQKPIQTVVRPRAMVEEVTKDCVKPIELVIEDDFGIKEVRCYFRVIDDKKPDFMVKIYGEKELFPPSYGVKKLKVTDLLEVGLLGIKEKDTVELKWQSEDFKDMGEKNISETKIFQLRIVSTSELEAKLEAEIEKLKQDLKKLLSRQGTLQTRADFMRNKYQGKPDLTADERGEIRTALAIEQNEITTKLESVWKDLGIVMERGMENRIFDERSGEALKKAVDILKELTTTTTNPPGPSYAAAQQLLSAAKSKTASARDQALMEGRRLQSETYDGISRALDALDKWATFQEAVRIARAAYEAAGKFKKEIEKQRCPKCRAKQPCAIHKD
jgi:hypothetical protein